MDSALKQRLIGAAVLIALAVIFVPMFLSGSPPKTETVTENLAIPPAPEREFQTRVVPTENGKPPVASAPVAEHVTPAGGDKVATVDAGTNPRLAAEVPYAAAPGAAPATTRPTAAATKPVETAAARPVPERAAPAASSTGRYAVHLGIFANSANADALVAGAKKQGLTAYTESAEVDGKPATRVRLGPYEDRSTAEAARLKLQKADPKLKGSVVEIAAAAAAAPKADAPVAALPANRAGGWAVQLGAFKSQDEANKLLAKAKGAGLPSFVDSTGQGAEKLWRVRLGPEPDRAGSEKLRDQAKQKLAITGMIVTVP